jgi:hypothetical protein
MLITIICVAFIIYIIIWTTLIKLPKSLKILKILSLNLNDKKYNQCLCHNEDLVESVNNMPTVDKHGKRVIINDNDNIVANYNFENKKWDLYYIDSLSKT